MNTGFINNFLKLESSGGITLMLSATAALLAANSPLASHYEALCASPLSFWINDGLMAVFFLLIGLEIKREVVRGELSTRSQALLPLVAALGGIVTPALIYWAFNQGQPALRGWAIPSATDIAFSLGVLALFGNKLNPSLKIFLMAVAVIDDLAAVAIIAVFYTDHLSFPALGVVAACVLILWELNRQDITHLWLYLMAGAVMWIAMLGAGVHPTVAGVLLGFLIPLEVGKSLEQKLHPWVTFAIMPLFAFFNAGIPLAGLTMARLSSPVTSGIALGLLAGKQAGIFISSWLLIKLGIATLPKQVRWCEFYGVSLLAGIGFTMSLFIGTLAFGGNIILQFDVRLGVLIGSLLSAVFGYIVLAIAARTHSGNV